MNVTILNEKFNPSLSPLSAIQLATQGRGLLVELALRPQGLCLLGDETYCTRTPGLVRY